MKEEIRKLVEEANARAGKASADKWEVDDDFGMPAVCSDRRRICDVYGENADVNAEFIANARQDLPALCAAIREMDMLARENDKRARHAEQERDAFDRRIQELESRSIKAHAAMLTYVKARNTYDDACQTASASREIRKELETAADALAVLVNIPREIL